MGRVIVEVMLKDEILDPQGKAIVNAFKHMDISNFVSVRQGKRFELQTSGGVTEEDLLAAGKAAETLLSNPVIESVVNVYDASKKK